MLGKKYFSIPFFLIIGPHNAIWISSFGSIQLGKDDHLLFEITDFKILTNFRSSLALTSIR